VEAPPHRLTDDNNQDDPPLIASKHEDLAAFVSSDHIVAATKNIHHHQQNTQQVHIPEDLAAFVPDHHVVPNNDKNLPQQQQKSPPTTSQQQQQQQPQQRRWGTAAGKTTPTSPIPPTRTFQAEHGGATTSNESSLVQDGVGGSSSSSSSATGLPFVPPKVTATSSSSSHTSSSSGGATASPVKHAPPEGFVVTARVYTDPDDKLSHFDSIPTNIALPFYECGAMGLSTNALPLSHASFRYALAGSQLWSGDFFVQNNEQEPSPQPRGRKRNTSSSSSPTSTPSSTRMLVEEDERQDWHPQLVIALTELEIVLNSGENKVFRRGDVILLEDTVLGGHKLRASTSSNQLPQDMTVLILTLPHYYHQIGKGQHSLQGFTTTLTSPPCPIDDDHPTMDSTKSGNADETIVESQSTDTRLSASFAMPQSVMTRRPHKKQIQQLVLGMIGISVSALVADFLGKVAPLWLAVGIGGTCFVVGGTYGVVTTGMQALEYLDMTWERQRLLSSMTTTPTTTTVSPTTDATTTGTAGNSNMPSDRPEFYPKPKEPPFYER
jgi:hypothetical protein